ncbi:MAG: TonB-dependent receptor [Parasphingorhabdus sp.]
MRNFRQSIVPASVIAIALTAQPALGQDEQSASNADIIVSAQRANQTQVIREGSLGALGDKAAENVPFSIKAYGEALILNQQPQTLGQLLENDPSVRTSYGFGTAAEQFVIRGFTLTSDDVGLDGLYGIVPRQLVSPELYEQVQVLNGASAFLNGASPGGSGIGGSVNLLPKRARDEPLTRVTANFTSDAHFGGSFDVSRRIADGSIGIRVNGAARRGDVAIDNEFRSNYVLGGAIDYNDGGPLRLSLDLAFQRVRINNLRPKVTVSTTSIPRVPDTDYNYGQPWTYTKQRDIFGLAKMEYDLADNVLAYASFGFRDGMEEGLSSGININDVVTGDAAGSALFVPRTDNNEAAQAGLRINLAGSGITHEFNVGGSMSWQVARYAYASFSGFTTNLYDTPAVPMPVSTSAGGDLDNPFPMSRIRLGSVYISDSMGFLNDRILLTAGLRLQTMNIKGYVYDDGSLTTEYDESAVTPVVGLVVKPVDGLSLFANRIEGLSQGPTAPNDPDDLVNPGEIFAPFKSTQYEIGGKVNLGRFNASLALFQIDKPSAYAIPVDAADPDSLGIFGVYGKQRNRGIEFSIDGEPVEGLRIIAGASILDAKQRDAEGGLNEGNKIFGVPEYLINANVEWDLPFLPALTLTGRVVHTGKQAANVTNTLELPEWTRFDLGARYVALVGDMPLTLRFNVDNVANKRYWASAFDSFRADLLQGAPRTFKLSASIEL